MAARQAGTQVSPRKITAGASPSLYIHVPFCRSICSYCDFHRSLGSRQAMDAWLAAVKRHVAWHKEHFKVSSWNTVYVGGGTPSALPNDMLSELLALPGVRNTGVEFTLEANPDDIDDAFLETATRAGVTRISVGVQSLEDDARTAVARRGSSDDIKQALERLSRSWNGELSADMIYGLPRQTESGLAADIAYLAGLGFDHLSVYELTLAEGTSLADAVRDGTAKVAGSDDRARLWDAAVRPLRDRGYERYEVSNWAVPGRECRHNQVYWSMGDWLAAGPSASGNLYNGDGTFLRMDNTWNDTAYAADPVASCSESVVSGKDAWIETLMMAMRTKKGLDSDTFVGRFGRPPEDVFGPALTERPDVFQKDSHGWKPTERGMDVLNSALVACMMEADRREGST